MLVSPINRYLRHDLQPLRHNRPVVTLKQWLEKHDNRKSDTLANVNDLLYQHGYQPLLPDRATLMTFLSDVGVAHKDFVHDFNHYLGTSHYQHCKFHILKRTLKSFCSIYRQPI